MIFKYIKSIQLLFLLVIALVFSSCNKDEEASPNINKTNVAINKALFDLMKEWYYWNDKLPSSFDASKFDTPEAALEALRYKTSDKWSYMEDTVAFNRYFSEGKIVGFGFGMKIDENEELRVSFVYKDSPIDKQNVTRGYKINKVNGSPVKTLLDNNTFFEALGENKPGIQVAFEVEDLNGIKRNISLAKEEVNMNTVLYRTVKSLGSSKVGYLVFNTFIEKSNAELDEAFAYFQSEGVSELVLDLRYNGGGSLGVAQHLASLIGASQTAGKLFVELDYNQEKQDKNVPINFESTPYDLHLNRLLVITTRSSASASEAVINGLRPYLPVYTIGDDSHGKPVGMNIFTVGPYAVAPVTFKVANANGQAEYYDGIKANSLATDNLNFLLGNAQEDCLNQALNYIEKGSFNLANGRTYKPISKQLELEGFRREIGAF